MIAWDSVNEIEAKLNSVLVFLTLDQSIFFLAMITKLPQFKTHASPPKLTK